MSSKSGYLDSGSGGSWLTDTEINIFPKPLTDGRILVENSGGGGYSDRLELGS